MSFDEVILAVIERVIPDRLDRIAAALERIATALERQEPEKGVDQ